MWLTSLFGKAKNISSELSSYQKKLKRLNICEGCNDKRDNFRFLWFEKEGISQCGICKCALIDKTIWEDEQCPKGKW
tara:strand:- start:141 stop:371 length:231 start_codon:yes stop_codon:yes gene_type:complete